tara:strand:+ start:2985 stop:3209 length:225 start_codon:yes stop_codon:yes gene_type:complete
MNAVEIAKMVIDNGYLSDDENRYEDNSINWNFVSADLHIDSPLEISRDAEEEAYDLLQECINKLCESANSPVVH